MCQEEKNSPQSWICVDTDYGFVLDFLVIFLDFLVNFWISSSRGNISPGGSRICVQNLSPEIGDTSLPAAAQLTLKAFKYLQNFLEILSIAPPNITLLQPFDRYVSNQFCDQIGHLSCLPSLTKM